MNAKKQNKLAQTATEYLIILAVVIIIALIVVGVLGGIPGLGGDIGGGTGTLFWTTQEVGVSLVLSASGGNALSLQNNRQNPVVIQNFTIVGETSNIIIPSNGVVIQAGETRNLVAGTHFNSTEINNTGICGVGGDSYAIQLSVTYMDQTTGASYTMAPNRNYEGSCAN